MTPLSSPSPPPVPGFSGASGVVGVSPLLGSTLPLPCVMSSSSSSMTLPFLSTFCHETELANSTILVAMPKSARRTTTAHNAVRSYEHRIVSNTLCLFLDIGTVYAICWYSKRHFSVQDRLIFYCWLQPAIRKQAPWYHTSGTLRPKYSVLCTKKGSALPVL